MKIIMKQKNILSTVRENWETRKFEIFLPTRTYHNFIKISFINKKLNLFSKIIVRR